MTWPDVRSQTKPARVPAAGLLDTTGAYKRAASVSCSSASCTCMCIEREHLAPVIARGRPSPFSYQYYHMLL